MRRIEKLEEKLERVRAGQRVWRFCWVDDEGRVWMDEEGLVEEDEDAGGTARATSTDQQLDVLHRKS